MDEQFMRQAISLAEFNVKNNRGGPFGAVIVKDQKIIAYGANSVTITNDPTAHAEIMAIRQACKTVGNFRINGCILYSSCEPCPMCFSACYWARLDMVYYAATKEDAAEIGFDDSYIYQQILVAKENRSISMVQIMRQEALPVFSLWQDTIEKISY